MLARRELLPQLIVQGQPLSVQQLQQAQSYIRKHGVETDQLYLTASQATFLKLARQTQVTTVEVRDVALYTPDY